MDSGFYSAFTGLASRMQSLDLLANNLANVNTAGYKSEKSSTGPSRPRSPTAPSRRSTRPSTITA
jgi:flagellar basal body rod protein FlgG